MDSSGKFYIADVTKAAIVIETLSGGIYTQTKIGSGISGLSESREYWHGGTRNSKIMRYPAAVKLQRI